ncbi:histidine kinase [Alkalinema pantanalense CENA528]|uniref:histidine kinase n=1 Tax=Alkalinema pantanalense TaxID=1620705 RepID=UPI003D7019C6
MSASPDVSPQKSAPLQLLLFVDQRPTAREQVRQIRSLLQELEALCPFDLQVIDVGEQPYLAEHFRLIATPALVKVHPDPRQTLAGSNLIAQLKSWWPRWQRSTEEFLAENRNSHSTEASASLAIEKVLNREIPSISQYAEMLQLSDDVFRLKQETEELRSKLQFKDQIIAMLAHDLRNPLTAASIAIETLEMGNKPQANQPSRLTPALVNQLLKHARTQIRVIDRMITDILQAARGSSADLNVWPIKVDLANLCQEVVTDLHDRLTQKQQTLELDIPSDLPPVYADASRIHQVLTNLLDNAIKYTPCQGTISLSVLHRTTQKVQVSICDNGPGIPEDQCNQIFEDHFRLQRDEEQEGYGIGLSLCQRIVRAHYGQIWVDSVPNQGSCFHFTLPVYRVQNAVEDAIAQ